MLGTRLKELRTEKGITQDDISKVLGIAKTTYASYEQGRREPDYETLAKLAKYFNVTTDYLLGQNSAPRWATPEDIVDLKEVLEGREQPRFNFGGDKLTDDQNSKLKLAITQIFWEKLRDQKGAGRDD